MKFDFNSRNKIYDDRYEYDDSNDSYNSEECDYVEYENTEHMYNYEESYDNDSTYKNNKKTKYGFKKFLKSILLIILCISIGSFVIGYGLSFVISRKTNFLIIATDEGGTRTDTIMLGIFDKKSKEISLISIPRDTYVTVSDSTFAKMNENYPEPGSKSMKINAVHHFGGEKYGTDMVVEQVESLVNLNIDFYAKIDIEAFKYIVDSVGGITFDVPVDMEYYDPAQDLNISLKKGVQHLNGDQAEQVVRFRSGYANADLGRVNVQQQFVKAFIEQALSPKSILKSPGTYFNVIFKYDYVDTNLNVINVISYAFAVNGLETDNIESYTLPGRAEYVGGQSVYKYNPNETQALINSIN